MDDARTGDLGGEYADPVGQLLTIGQPPDYDPAEWPDYSASFGLGPEHIDALIRLACDVALNTADTQSGDVWGPMHAWRALGQLRAEAATVPLLALLNSIVNDGPADEEIPVVFGMIGPAAIPHIKAYLSDRSNPVWSAAMGMAGLKEIVRRHPDCRAETIGILIGMLKPHADANRTVSGFAVSGLMDLRAVEAIDPIRDAFRRDSVDISIAGDVEDVEIGLGLRASRATPAPHYSMEFGDWSAPSGLDRKPGGIPVLAKRQDVGRNDPCPCGSGKKYKKCCL